MSVLLLFAYVCTLTASRDTFLVVKLEESESESFQICSTIERDPNFSLMEQVELPQHALFNS